MNENVKTGDPRPDSPAQGHDGPDGSGTSRTWQPTPEAMAKGLGWFSIALGLAELLAPRATARATGAQHGKNLLQAYGVREIATGGQRNHAPGV